MLLSSAVSFTFNDLKLMITTIPSLSHVLNELVWSHVIGIVVFQTAAVPPENYGDQKPSLLINPSRPLIQFVLCQLSDIKLEQAVRGNWKTSS